MLRLLNFGSAAKLSSTTATADMASPTGKERRFSSSTGTTELNGALDQAPDDEVITTGTVSDGRSFESDESDDLPNAPLSPTRSKAPRDGTDSRAYENRSRKSNISYKSASNHRKREGELFRSTPPPDPEFTQGVPEKATRREKRLAPARKLAQSGGAAKRKGGSRMKSKAGRGRNDGEDESEDGKPVYSIPTRQEYASSAWTAFQATEVVFDDIPVRVREGDCVYIIPPEEVGAEDGDRDKTWIALVKKLKAEATVLERLDAAVSRTTAVEGDIILEVLWFYRIRDVNARTPGLKGVPAILKRLGFRDHPGGWEFQDREIILSSHVDLIHSKSICGLADVYYFNDQGDATPDNVLRHLVHPRTAARDKEPVSPGRLGLSAFYHRLTWAGGRYGSSKWTPALPKHCICRQHYDPRHKMVFCPSDRCWYHAACLVSTGHITGGTTSGSGSRKRKRAGAPTPKPPSEGTRSHAGSAPDAPAPAPALALVPADLREVAGRAIVRGGAWELLAGNYALVTSARDLVAKAAAAQADEADLVGWREVIGMDEYTDDLDFVRSYHGDMLSEAAKRKVKAMEDPPDGERYRCPDCGSVL